MLYINEDAWRNTRILRDEVAKLKNSLVNLHLLLIIAGGIMLVQDAANIQNVLAFLIFFKKKSKLMCQRVFLVSVSTKLNLKK